MQLTLLENDKLKIILTPFDMIQYDLTCEKIDYDNTETRRAVWNILDEAKHKTGFDAAMGRIFIQVYPVKNGGCEIYITKLQKEEIPSEKDMTYAKEKLPLTTEKSMPAVYGFGNMDDLLRVCEYLWEKGYSEESSAYAEPPENAGTAKYYLIIYENQSQCQNKSAKLARDNLFIGEFGTKCPGENTVSYIKEYCRCFCEKNAVKILSDMI